MKDMTQRFPEGMREIFEEPVRTETTFGEALEHFMEDERNGDMYVWVNVVINGDFKQYRSLEEVKRLYADKLNEYLYTWYWHDTEVGFIL